jgi:4-hydroxy-tetrahydrodipicolinate synthase
MDAAMKTTRVTGVLAPVVTPFRADTTPDRERFVRHCQWLLAHGCAGLAVFGTNSEANSMSVAEKAELLDALVDAGVPAAKLMPGTGACALPDSIALTKKAVALGCGGVLMLPPFYYKGVSDEGLYRNFAEVIERVGDARLQLYLYHIPPVSGVPITLALIERLLKAYPQALAGAKDSSGDWSNTRAMLDAFGKSGFDVFPGSEVFLLDGLRAGGKGCITATGNINPAAIDKVYRSWRSNDADALQAGITATRKIVQSVPMIPALKAAIAHYAEDPEWKRLRPPLVELSAAEEKKLLDGLAADGFAMPGIEAVACPVH